MRKVIFGFVWFLVLYFGFCALVGAAAGLQAARRIPDNYTLSPAMGREIGRQAAEKALPTIFRGSVTLSILGSAFGILPGTRSRRPPEFAEADGLQPAASARQAARSFQR